MLSQRGGQGFIFQYHNYWFYFFFNQSNSHPALDNIFSEAHIKANNILKQIPP